MKISLPIYMIFTIITFLLSKSVNAEFYIWHDENGVKHVSNVPRECILENQTVKISCLPKGKPIINQKNIGSDGRTEIPTESLRSLEIKYAIFKMEDMRSTGDSDGREAADFIRGQNREPTPELCKESLLRQELPGTTYKETEIYMNAYIDACFAIAD